jgi:hypothetical protein
MDCKQLFTHLDFEKRTRTYARNARKGFFAESRSGLKKLNV